MAPRKTSTDTTVDTTDAVENDVTGEAALSATESVDTPADEPEVEPAAEPEASAAASVEPDSPQRPAVDAVVAEAAALLPLLADDSGVPYTTTVLRSQDVERLVAALRAFLAG